MLHELNVEVVVLNKYYWFATADLDQGLKRSPCRHKATNHIYEGDVFTFHHGKSPFLELPFGENVWNLLLKPPQAKSCSRIPLRKISWQLALFFRAFAHPGCIDAKTQPNRSTHRPTEANNEVGLSEAHEVVVFWGGGGKVA